MQRLQDIHIRGTERLISPRDLKLQLPVSEEIGQTVYESRQTAKRILQAEDKRLLVVVGPCSIHDPESALEYAKRLADLARRVADRIFIVMRVYFEKPRTTVGWKGLINDPHLDDSFDIKTGLKIARQLLLDINALGLPAATEMLEPITPQYIADLITLASIGARTTESPTHRQMASGLSMPVGFKNSTDGSIQVALDAMLAARSPHSFLGIDPDGQTCVVNTAGNPWGHLIVRGGRSGPNYSRECLSQAAEQLRKANMAARIVVDCSHANSDKDYRKQCIAWNDVVEQAVGGNNTIVGMMLESNLEPGNQKLGDPKLLKRGVSITDACIGWDETQSLLLDAHAKLGA